jgi:uncharacterized membrane protein YcaP (DUF421 family)
LRTQLSNLMEKSIPDLKETIYKLLIECRVDDYDDLHQRLTSKLEEDGINAIYVFEDEIPPRKFQSLKTKILEISSLFKNNSTDNNKSEHFILSVLKKLKIDDDDGDTF